MKSIIRISISLLIVLLLLSAFSVGILAAVPDENTPDEEIATDEENGLSRVEALWIALMPSVGATIAAAAVAYKIISQFKDLRADVIADGQIAALKKENKTLQKSIERLIQIQETEFKDTESLQRSIKSMEQTAQKLELHMSRLEASMNEPEKGVMGHL